MYETTRACWARSQMVTLCEEMYSRLYKMLRWRTTAWSTTGTGRLAPRIAVEPVLLVDDDVELCAMLGAYVARHGFEVTTEHHGDLGLHRALSGSFSIVLLDVMLPGLDGFEVLRRLRSTSSVSVL